MKKISRNYKNKPKQAETEIESQDKKPKKREKSLKSISKITQKDKTKFRNSPEWQDFRSEQLTTKKCTCDCCYRKLPSSKLSVHHKDLNADNYTNISNKQHFSLLCSHCHSSLHSFYTIIANRKNLTKNRDIYNLIKTFFLIPDYVTEYFKLLDNR